MTRSKLSRLGLSGALAATLATTAGALLGTSALGALPQAWVPQVAAALGIAAGLAGGLGLWRRAEPPAMAPARPAAILPPDTMENIAALLRSMAEEMVRLKRDGAEASRSMAEARHAGRSMVEAAGIAIARLDESAESSAIAARALSMLPGIADSHAQRIELMAARAEQALALVPDAMATGNGATAPPADMLQAIREAMAELLPLSQPGFPAEALESALSRLEALPGEIASAAQPPDNLALEAAVARLDALPGEIGAALAQQPALEFPGLEAAIGRLEAARPDPMLALGVMEATERLEAMANQITQALGQRQAGESAPALDPSALAETLRAALAPGLAELMGRRFTALSNAAQPAMTALVERMEGATTRLEAAPEAIAQALDIGLVRCETAADRLEAVPEHFAQAMDGRLHRWDGTTTGLETIAQTLEVGLGRCEAAADLFEALPERFGQAMDERLDRWDGTRTGLEAITQTLGNGLGRCEAAAGRLEALPRQLSQAMDGRLERWDGAAARLEAVPTNLTQAVDRQLAHWDSAAGRLDGMPAAIAEEIDSHLTRWSGDMASLPASLGVAAGRIEAAGASLQDGLAALAAQAGTWPGIIDAHLAPLAAAITGAAAGTAEGLAAHLGALETLGPVLDGVTERLIDTANALAATGQSLPPMADAAQRAMDALVLGAQSRTAPAAEPVRHPAPRAIAAPGASVAASILGRLATQEEPAIAATLMRLDGIGTEVASLLRETETLVGPGHATLSRPVAKRAPELLESLNETIRGLQSISTAIAVAADRRLEHARAS